MEDKILVSMCRVVLAGVCLLGCAQDDRAAASGEQDGTAGAAALDTDGPGERPDDEPIYTGGCDAIELAEPDSGAQLRMHVDVSAADEGEYCKLVVLQQDINLNGYDGLFTSGSHHANIYTTRYKGSLPTTTIYGARFPDAGEAHPCMTPEALWDTTGTIGFGRDVRRRDERPPAFPQDVAFKLEAGDVVLLNFHMINTTEEDISACFKVNLNSVPDEQVVHEAGMFFFYNPFITVPAAGTSTARQACPITQEVSLLNAFSHMHERGVGAQAYLYDGPSTASDSNEMMQLYDQHDWAEPRFELFGEGLQLRPGQFIDYRCDYLNPDDVDVAQGFASTDEMCQFIGMYYPRDPQMEACEQPLLIGTGNDDGAAYLDCSDANPTDGNAVYGAGHNPRRYAIQRCVTETCPGISAALSAHYACGQRGGTCDTEEAELLAARCD